MIQRALISWLSWPMLFCIASLMMYFFQASFQDKVSAADAEIIKHVISAAIVYSVAWMLSRIVSMALTRKGKGKRKTPRLLGELLRAGLFTIATIIAVGLVLGQSPGGILASSGLIIAILGFAIRNVLADVLSGIAIGLEAPYRIGDWVEFDVGTSGRVIEIGWRTTRILTTNGTYMILPNSHISRQMLTNYSAPRKHYQACLRIILSHEVPIGKAKEVLLAAAHAASEPMLASGSQKPMVHASQFGIDGIAYTIQYWVPSFADDVDCRDAMLAAIDHAIRKERLSVPVRPAKAISDKLELAGDYGMA
ncbi:mechanosensitive ion channel family protein [Parapusillimonas sp. JC17]|uniref:mechanosensitive ion channel family protein n=1 Tax=Parapusillimonas sp. JC17 TaxID=3445768 RepID=UPI003FA12E25